MPVSGAGNCGTEKNPGLSCSDIFQAGGAAGNGVYYVRRGTKVLPVFCDMDLGGLQMVGKFSHGVGNDDSYRTWLGTGTQANEVDVDVVGHPEASSSPYVSTFRSCWNNGECIVKEVVVRVYKDGEAAKTIFFDGEDSTHETFFSKERVKAASWSDLTPSATTNYFSQTGWVSGASARRWFINEKYGGCGVDAGWLVVTLSPAVCGWENTGAASKWPAILYSPTNTASNWDAITTSSSHADTLGIFVRYEVIGSSSVRSCVSGDAALRLLASSGTQDGTTIKDLTGNGHDATANGVTMAEGGWSGEEVATFKSEGMVLLDPPQFVRWKFTAPNTKRNDVVPPGVPVGATAVLTTIVTWQSNRNDHLLHSFGRNNNHNTYTWDNRVYDLNTHLNDVIITHNGDSARGGYYGYNHGSQIIPLKENGKFDVMQGMGKNNHVEHWIWISVIGYFTEEVTMSTGAINNIRIGTGAPNSHQGPWSALTRLDSGKREKANAVIVSCSHFQGNRNDHWVTSFGRNRNHNGHTWDNAVYSHNERKNDVMFTNEGDASYSKHYYGHSRGTMVIPLKDGKNFEGYIHMGKNGWGSGTAYTTMQEYGYFTDRLAGFLENPVNNRMATTSSCNRHYDRDVPAEVPSDAVALITAVSTFLNSRDDHITFSFGRKGDHHCTTWGTDPYNRNEWLNDALITVEGNGAGRWYYGHSHGTVIIPLKDNGKWDAVLSMGKSDGSWNYVTVQIYGYILGTKSTAGGDNQETGMTVDYRAQFQEFTTSMVFQRSWGQSSQQQLARQCDSANTDECAWELVFSPGVVRARVPFGEVADVGAWDLSVPVDQEISRGDPAYSRWHHAVLRYDGAAGVAQLTVDGVTTAITDMFGTLPGDGQKMLLAQKYDGRMYDFRLWNRALTGSEVQALYSVYEKMFGVQGMALWWTAREGSGAEVGDFASPHGGVPVTGVLQGGAGWRGAALSFTASSQMVLSTKEIKFPATDPDVSLSAWVMSTADRWSGLACFMGSYNNDGTNRQLSLCTYEGRPAANFANGVRVEAVSSITTGRWHHVAMVKRAGSSKSSTTAMFVNGEKVTTALIGGNDGALNIPQSTRWVVGRGASNLDEGWWQGYVSDARVLKYAVSDDSVAAMAGVSGESTLANPVLLWWKARDGDKDADGQADRSLDDSGPTGSLTGIVTGGLAKRVPSSNGAGGVLLQFRGEKDFVMSAAPTVLTDDLPVGIMVWLYYNGDEWPDADADGRVLVAGLLPTDEPSDPVSSRVALVLVDGAPAIDFGGGVLLVTSANDFTLRLKSWNHLCVSKASGSKEFATHLFVNGVDAPLTLVKPDDVAHADANGPLKLGPNRLVLSVPDSDSLGMSVPDTLPFLGFIDDVRVLRQAPVAASVSAWVAATARNHWRDMAVRLNGQGDYVELPAATLGGGAMTISMFVLARTPLEAAQTLYDSGDGPRAVRCTVAIDEGTGRLRYTVNNDPEEEGEEGTLVTPAAVPYNQWVHITVSHTDDGEAAIYFGDYLQVRGAVPVPVEHKRGSTFVGRSLSGTRAVTFNGVVDEVTVWTEALSPADIRDLRDARTIGYGDKVAMTYSFTKPSDGPGVDLQLSVEDRAVKEDMGGGHGDATLRCDGCLVVAPHTTPACGNGVREAGEQCDDGGRFSNDGCDSKCRTEGGYICSSESPFEADVCVRGSTLFETSFEMGESGNDEMWDHCSGGPNLGGYDASSDTTTNGFLVFGIQGINLATSYSTSRAYDATAVYSNDVADGASDSRSIEFKKATGGNRPYQWFGNNVDLKRGDIVRMSVWMKFLTSPPERNPSTGFRNHAGAGVATDNDFLIGAPTNKWFYAERVYTNDHDGSDLLILIFDDAYNGMRVRFSDFKIDVLSCEGEYAMGTTSLDGGGWKRWWWFQDQTSWPGAADVLQNEFGSCDPQEPYCFGRLPAHLQEDHTELLAVDSANTAYKWGFNSGIATAHAAWLAFHDHVQQYASFREKGTWNPTVLDGPFTVATQDAFMYRPQHGTVSVLLDDDNCDCESTLSMGHGMCGSGFSTSYGANNRYGVDLLNGKGCDSPNPDHGLYLFYRAAQWRHTIGEGSIKASRDAAHSGVSGLVFSEAGGASFAEVTLTGAVGAKTYLQFDLRIEAAKGDAVPLVITLTANTETRSPTDNGSSNFLRVCFNPSEDDLLECDEIYEAAPQEWVTHRLNVQSKFQQKYGRDRTAPKPLRLNVGTYTKDSDAATKVWFDNVRVYDSDEVAPPGSCAKLKAASVHSSGGWPSCKAIHDADPNAPDGEYVISPDGEASIKVMCDMTTDGGGWIVLQNRFDGSVGFYRGWADYRDGFGSTSGEHWLGLKHARTIVTELSGVNLRVDLHSHDGGHKWMRYSSFSVGPDSDQFRLSVGGYTGNQADGIGWMNGMRFTTHDSDNDVCGCNCAHHYKGGWWYTACHATNYNGIWGSGPVSTYANYICDAQWKGYYVAIPRTRMMLREDEGIKYNVDKSNLFVGGDDKALASSGLSLVTFPPGFSSSALRTALVSTTGDGSDMAAFVDGLAEGDIVMGALSAHQSNDALGSTWQDALASIGVSTPVLTPSMRWAFIGTKGARLGDAAVDVVRTAEESAEATTYFNCPAQPPARVPGNRIAASAPLRVRDGEEPRLEVAGGDPSGQLTVDEEAHAIVSRTGLFAPLSGDKLHVQAYERHVDSGWKTMTSQAGSGSFFTVDVSDLGLPPERLQVHCYHKARDGDNLGFAFRGMGAAMRTDDDGTYSGLVFAYSGETVRVWAPSRNDGGADGRMIGVGKGWGLENEAQESSTSSARVVVVAESAADYDSDWFDFKSQQGANSFKEVAHGLGAIPDRVKVLVKATDGVNKDFVFEAVGSAQADDGGGRYGGVVFAYNDANVRLWAPDANDGDANGFIIHIGDGWGGESFAQSSHNAKVRILAWREHRSADFASPEKAITSSSATAFMQVAHNLGQVPAYVQVQVIPATGDNADYRFEGVGGVQADGGVGRKYGGVVYAVDDTYVRVWAPSVDPDSGNDDGYLVYAKDGWGGETNPAAEAIGSVVIKAWSAVQTVAETGTLSLSVTRVNSAPSAPDVAALIDESAEEGSHVASIAASDPDGDKVSYELVAGNLDGTFALDAVSGTITIARPGDLNYFVRPTYVLNVAISDGIAEDIVAVVITLKDKNRAPTIHPGTLYVSEAASLNSAVGGRLNYTEEDNGDSVVFDVVSGNELGLFKLDPCLGQFFLAKAELDYETTRNYTLRVSATDNGDPPLSSEADILVSVVDANDPPICTDLTRAVDENSPKGEFVGLPVAADDPDGNALAYSIEDGNVEDAFTINAEDGQISVAVDPSSNVLDYETIDSFDLTIRATDDGEGTPSCTMVVTVTLNNANDPPQVQVTDVSVPEGEADGSLVAVLTPVDVDPSDISTIVFHPDSEGQNVFDIDEDTAKLTVATGGSVFIDYELTTAFHLRFIATDSGGPDDNKGDPLSSEANVTVHIQNINDAPVLTLGTGEVSENADIDTMVTIAGGSGSGNPIAASDPDGDTLDYEITFGTPFSIGASTGVLSVVDPEDIDYEEQSTWDVEVHVTDDGDPPLTASATFTVNILDANDAPVIDCEVGAVAMARFAGMNAVRTLTALVLDEGAISNDLIDFNNPASPVDDANACNQLCIDNEMCAAWTFFDDTYFDATRAGKCFGRTDSTSEQVLDVPAATSGFKTQLCQQFTVAEDLAEGSDVGDLISATDEDGDSPLTFSIVFGDDDGHFEVGPGTTPLNMQLRLASGGALDYDTEPDHFIGVRVDDGGEEGRETVTVHVAVTNVDEPPTFDDQTRSVAEGWATGTVVGASLGCADPEGASVTYAITGGNTGTAFAVDNAGVLTLAKPMTASEGDTYALTIDCSDGVQPATEATVTVEVFNGNLPPVLFEQTRYVPENSPVDTNVGPPLSWDDGDPEDTHTFQITRSNNSQALFLFAIDGPTGQITVNRNELDYESMHEYWLWVSITDNGAGQFSDEAVVRVVVTDVNEPPECPSLSTYNVNENSPVDTVVHAAFRCDDPDGDDLTFTVSDPGAGTVADSPPYEDGIFSVTKVDGSTDTARIETAKPNLDYETRSEYSLTVTVSDGEFPQTPTVVVRINNINEPPVGAATQPFDVPEDESAASQRVLFTVDASDPENQPMTFALDAASDPDGMFAVDQSTGAVRLATQLTRLDFEDVDSYALVVVVTDAGGLQDTIDVPVTVLDVDDVTVDAIAGATADGGFLADEDGNWLMDTEGMEIVTLTGTNFGPTGRKINESAAVVPDVVVTYGASGTEIDAINCTVTPNTGVSCITSPGVGKDHIWVVTLNPGTPGAVTAIATVTTRYQPPAIQFVSGAEYMATIGGDNVTIFGEGFGPGGTPVKVWYGSSNAPFRAADCEIVEVIDCIDVNDFDTNENSTVCSSTSHAECWTVEGVGKDLPWQLEVGGQRSEWYMPEACSYAVPRIRAVELVQRRDGAARSDDDDASLWLRLDTRGGDVVLLHGTNFGPAVLDVEVLSTEDPDSPRVPDLLEPREPDVMYGYADGGQGREFVAFNCRVVEDHVAVACETSAGVGSDLWWTVDIEAVTSGERFHSVGDVAAEYPPLAYRAPALIAITGAGAEGAATEGGDLVVIQGTDFGPASLGNSIDWVKYGPTGWEYTLEEPEIVARNSASGNSPTAEGSLRGLIAPGTGKGHSWRASIGGQESVLLEAGTSYAAPIVASFSGEGSEDAVTWGGEIVYVHGSNFGNSDDKVESVVYSRPGVRDYDAANCTIYEAHTVLQCQTIEGSGKELSWTVVVDGQDSTNPLTNYGAPEIHALVGEGVVGASTDGGQEVIIQGTNFATMEHLESVTYGPTGREYTLRNVVVESHTRISGVTAPGIGSGLLLIVRVGGQDSVVIPDDGAATSISYAPPTILSVTPSTDITTFATTTLTVRGRNFGLLDPVSDVRILVGHNDDRSIIPPRVPFNMFPASSSEPGYVPGSQHSVQFQLPPGIGAERPVRVMVFRDGQEDIGGVVSDVAVVDYAPPSLRYIEVSGLQTEYEYNVSQTLWPDAFAAGSVRRLTLHGSNFGIPARQGSSGVARRVLIQETDPEGVPQDEFSDGIGKVLLLEWSVNGTEHNQTTILTPITYGRAKVEVLAVSGLPSGGPALRQSGEASFDKDQPSIGNLVGADGKEPLFDTAGGQEMQMSIAYLGATVTLDILLDYREGISNGTACKLSKNGIIVPDVADPGVLDGLDRETYLYNLIHFTDEITPETNWTIPCVVPAGQGRNVPVSVFRNGVPVAGTVIHYKPPSITAITVSDRPGDAFAATGATTLAWTQNSTVRLVGANFGQCPTVVLTYGKRVRWCDEGDDLLATPGTSIDPKGTWLQFEVPPGEGRYVPRTSTPFRLELSVGQQSPVPGNDNWPFSFRAPMISSVTDAVTGASAAPNGAALVGPTTGGTRLMISGTNFGDFRPGFAATYPDVWLVRYSSFGSVLDQLECEDVHQYSHERVACTVPEAAGAGYRVTVNVAGQDTDAPGAPVFSFSFAPPVITGLSIEADVATDGPGAIALASDGETVMGPTQGGFNLTVHGSNFGPTNYSGFCVLVEWSADPPSPRPTSCDDPAALRGSFNPLSGQLAAHRVWIGEQTHTSVKFIFPEAAGSRDVTLLVKGQAVTLARAFQPNPPVIFAMSPTEGPTDGGRPTYADNRDGEFIELTGANFGTGRRPQLEAVVVMFNGLCLTNATSPDGGAPEVTTRLECIRGDILVHNHNAIRFWMPGGIGREREVSVGVWEDPFTEQASNAVLFHYLPPQVTDVFPNPYLADADSQTVRIGGRNFGRLSDARTEEEREVAVTVHGTDCANARRIGDQNILECTLEPLIVGSKNVSITVASQTGEMMHTDNRALRVACQRGFYGQPGEPCLECPRGGVCHGFDDFQHTEPFSEPGWFKLNGTVDRCHADRVPTFGVTREFCVHITPCEPPWACTGDNQCEVGYRSVAPIHRCAQCDNCYRGPNGDQECKAFYRRAGECIECPDNPLLLILGFLVGGICAGMMGYVLNRKSVNLAFVSIGIDYFQVLAMFANSRVQWPAAIKELFIIMSVFNFNLEITAPECSIPDISYEQKWWFIMMLPLVAGALFLINHITLYCKKRFILRQSKKLLHSHVSTLIATGLVMFYFLYLQLSRTTLDVFNCSPTDPPDGYEYLAVVFEPCWQAGGLQMRLIGPAIITLIVYLIGYPSLVYGLLYKNKLKVMEDQLLRAMGKGDTKVDNPNCHEFRRRYHKIYYHFKPDKWYWITVIIARKLGIAFTSLMFNKNPAFQLSIALLIMFTCYALQVRHVPYMSPSERNQVLLDHEQSVADGDTVHKTLANTIAAVSKSGRKKTRNLGWKASRDKTQQAKAAAAAAAAFLFSYNSVEAILLACAVLVNLAGVMFESNRFDSDYYESQRDAIAYITILVIVVSIMYFTFVFISEIYTTLCAEKVAAKKMAADKAKGKRTTALPSRLGSNRSMEGAIEMSTGGGGRGQGSLGAGTNPLFSAGASGRDLGPKSPGRGAPPAAAGPAAEDVSVLLEENAVLRAEVQKLRKANELMAHAGPAARMVRGRGGTAARKKNEFAPQASAASAAEPPASSAGAGGVATAKGKGKDREKKKKKRASSKPKTSDAPPPPPPAE